MAKPITSTAIRLLRRPPLWDQIGPRLRYAAAGLCVRAGRGAVCAGRAGDRLSVHEWEMTSAIDTVAAPGWRQAARCDLA